MSAAPHPVARSDLNLQACNPLFKFKSAGSRLWKRSEIYFQEEALPGSSRTCWMEASSRGVKHFQQWGEKLPAVG